MTQTVHQPSYTRNGRPVKGSDQARKSAAPQSGRHRSMKARAQLAGAGSLAFVGAVQMLTAAMGLVTAVLTVSAASLIAWGGYKGAKKRRKRKGSKASHRAGWSRFGTIRLSTPAQIEAYAKWDLQKREARARRRDELWARRKAAVATMVRRGRP